MGRAHRNSKVGGATVYELAQKPAELEAFIEWKATPKEFREPPSQVKLAVVLGVTERTLTTWGHDPRVISKIEKRSAAQPLIDALPGIIKSMIEMATDPAHPRAVQAAKVYFELLHRQAAEPDQMLDVEQMSIAELKQHVAELYDAVDEQERKRSGKKDSKSA